MSFPQCFLAMLVISSGVLCACGTSNGGGGPTVDTDACLAAKQHLCQNLAGQACSTSTMDNAKGKVSAACTKASATGFFPWAEQACSARTLNCAALPRFSTPGDTNCAPPVDFHYSGTATADARTAQLDLTIKGTTVTGTLHADPVCQSGTHLTRTDFTFTATLSGQWEAEGSAIVGAWTGGDYDCDGKLVGGYPTDGSVTISLFGTKVSLRRITGGWDYAFGATGKTGVPKSCAADGG